MKRLMIVFICLLYFIYSVAPNVKTFQKTQYFFGIDNLKYDYLTGENANVSLSNGQSYEQSFVLDSNDYPHIAWVDTTIQKPDIYYIWFNGSNWVNIFGKEYNPRNISNANISNSLGFATQPSLALDSQGNPSICWTDNTNGNTDIYYIRFNGTNWICANGSIYDPLQPSSANVTNNSGWSEQAKLVIDKYDMPWILWSDGSIGTDDVYLVRWNGISWVNVNNYQYDPSTGLNSNISKTEGWSLNGDFVIDSSNKPHVVWQEQTYGNDSIIYIQWNGTNWIDLDGKLYDPLNSVNGKISQSDNVCFDPDIALDNLNQPFVAYSVLENEQSEIYYQKLIQSSIPTNVSRNPGYSECVDITFDIGNNLHLVWSDSSYGSYDILHVSINSGGTIGNDFLKYDNTAGINANVSQNQGDSKGASVSILSSGMACIVWSDESFGNYDIMCAVQGFEVENAKSLSMNVDTNSDYIFNNSGQEVKVEDVLEYKINFTDYAKQPQLNGSFLKVQIPQGTSYVVGANPNQTIEYSDDNGKIWKSGEPQEGSTYPITLRWSLSMMQSWRCFDNSVYNPGIEKSSSNIHITNTFCDSVNPIIKIDNLGYPNIVFVDTTLFGFTDIIFIKYDGQKWVGANGTPFIQTDTVLSSDINVSRTVGQSSNPSFELDKLGRPHIAWVERETGNTDIIYVYWNGTSWVNSKNKQYDPTNIQTSKILETSGITENPRLKLDKLNKTHITFEDNTYGNSDIYYLKLSETKWLNIQGSECLSSDFSTANVSRNNGESFSPSLALNSNNNPSIAWCDTSNYDAPDVFLVKSDYGTWLNANGQIYNPYSPGYTNVSNNIGASLEPVVFISPDQMPIVVWEDQSYGNSEIFLAKHNGINWLGMNNQIYDPKTGANCNISNSEGLSTDPKVALDSKGCPIVVFSDSTYLSSDIFCIKWSGDGWISVASTSYNPLSMLDSNVSNNGGDSITPSLSTDWFGNPHISWSDDNFGNSEIFYATWSSSSLTTQFKVKVVDTKIGNIKASAWYEYQNTESSTIVSNDVINSVSKLPSTSSGLSIKKLTSKSHCIPGDRVSFTITIENTQQTELQKVELIDHFPKELIFYNSQPTGLKTDDKIKFVVGTLNKGEKRKFILNFKVSEKLTNPSANQTITNLASCVANGKNSFSDSASIIVTRPQSSPGQLKTRIQIVGVNAVSECKAGDEISLTGYVEGGFKPYDMIVSWGDQEKVDDKDRMILKSDDEILGPLTHVFKTQGQYEIVVKISDSQMGYIKNIFRVTVR